MHRYHFRRSLFGLIATAALMYGCEGYMQSTGSASSAPGADYGPGNPDSPGDPGDPNNPNPTDVCAGISPGETPLPRLTEDEYNNTVRDLFPELDLERLSVPGDEKVGPFEANTSLAVGELVAEQYQENAEKVSERFVVQLDEVLTCAQTTSPEIYRGQAEDIGASSGAAQGEYWNLWSNGALETNVSIDRDGDYEIAIRAYGSQAGSEPAKMALNVNGEQLDVFDVAAVRDQPEIYRADIALPAGTHTISAAFTNDFNDTATGNDRNLIIDYIALTQNGRVEADEACVRPFIEDFGRRAYRRPLTDDEKTRLWQLFSWGQTEYGMATGLRGVVEAVLQSPKFLYRFKFGGEAEGEVAKLDDFEVASRLSYFLWDSMPDEELLAAAKAGELSTPEGIEAQARRMLGTQKARRAVNEAVLTWMGLDGLSSLERIDPDFTDAMRESMEASTRAYVDQIIWEGDGRLSTLLTAPFAYVDKETAPLYGVEPPEGDGLKRVELDGDKRLGLLTQPGVIARYSYGDATIHRGLFIRDAFLCSTPPPPPNEFEDPPETYEGQPLRERAEDRMSHQQCGACHNQIDPIGLTFDEYDALGRFQTEDKHGNPVHGGGHFGSTPIDGPVELARALADSEEVRQCVVRQWFRLAFARQMSQEDACSLQTLQATLDESNDDIRELLVAITTSDAFRYRRALDAP